MGPSSIFELSYYCRIFPVVMLLLAILYRFGGLKRKSQRIASTSTAAMSDGANVSRANPSTSKPTEWYRTMFFQLQHLEDHPNVLEAAREELLAMFSRAASFALKNPEASILSINQYDLKSVRTFLDNEHEKVLAKWGGYLQRRQKGKGPELFATTEEAKRWLVQQAPIKFVDGAWLAHIHKITTPFILRSVTKPAWQILSEELGDGDLSKHHVYLYRQLLQDVGCPLPDGHSAEFIKSSVWEGMNNHGAWEAAVGQLLISLFPNEFLPEILGFNMHYELITLETMQATHELKSLGIHPYYFLIHIAIDNADSGHTAMAMHTVTRYLDMICATEGDAALEQAWKRVQIGYILSQTLGSSHVHDKAVAIPAASRSFADADTQIDRLSGRLIDVIKAKASVSHQFHCQSRVNIGGQRLAEWLAPNNWTHSRPQQHLKLLKALSQTKPWIHPGASGKSLLVRELSWKGRMFGAFTNDELIVLTEWIDSLSPRNDAGLYWNYTGRPLLASAKAVAELQDPARHHPVVIPAVAGKIDPAIFEAGIQEAEFDLELKNNHRSLASPSKARLPNVIALWFVNIGLLENTINTPSRTAFPLYASILRLLRAQAGFALETHNVAGMDEMKRLSCPSLVDIGLELVASTGWPVNAKLSSLHDVLLLTSSQGQDESSAELTRNMLRWRARPNANLGLLLGLALAFLKLQAAVASAPNLLTDESRLILEAIITRESQSLGECVAELKRTDAKHYAQMVRGFQVGKSALEACW